MALLPLRTPLTELPKKNSPLLRLNSIAPYYTMFPLDFPFGALAGLPETTRVLDPFCGRGTTLFAARLRGMPAVGIDVSPVASAIAAAKLVAVTPEAVSEECARILNEEPSPTEVPAGAFWRMCYHPDTLREICTLREALLRLEPTPARTALRAVMLGILHGPRSNGRPSYLSNQMPRTYATKPAAAVRFWTKRNLVDPPRVDTLDLVTRRARFSFHELPPPVDGKVVRGDSRELVRSLSEYGFGAVVTSPPYPGMNTYISDQWLRYWFLGGPSDVNYDRSGQLGGYSSERFVSDLASVWRDTAAVVKPGARLAVRFGVLPSLQQDPAELLRRSLALSGRPWRVLKVESAGSARDGHRQADQFALKTSSARDEIDLYAVLEG